MKKLVLKLFRDIGKSLGQFIAVAVISAIGVTILTGFSVTYASMRNMTDAYYSSGALADMSAYYMGIDDAGIARIKSIPGVADAYGRLTLKASSPDNSADYLIHSFSADEKIDIPALAAGTTPQSSGECMVDDAYARANGLAAGDTVSVGVNGQTVRFRISGTVDSAEHVYLVEDPAKDPIPDHKAYGLLYVGRSAIANIAGSANYNEALIALEKNADAKAVKKAVEDATGSYGFGHVTLQKDQLSFSQLQSDIDTVNAIASSFPYIFFLVASAIIFISMSRTVQAERGQIGIMKALGIRTPAITLHYLGYSVIGGILGSIIGNLIGVIAIPRFMLGTYGMLYTFPAIAISGFWPYAALSTAVVVLFGIAASIVSARKVLKETPAQCMRPAPPKKVRKTWMERNETLWRRISYKNKLILRNILLNKQRAALSSIGIIGCVGVLLCGFGLREAASDLYNNQFSQMQRYDELITLSKPAPYETPAPFAAGDAGRADPFSMVQATASLGRDVSAMLYLLPAGNESIRLFGSDGRLLRLPEDGILMPYKLAGEYNVKVGDTVTLKLESALYKNADIRAKVSAIGVLYLSQDIYASYEYMSKLGVAPYVNGYYVSLKEGSVPASAPNPIAKAPNVKSVVSKANLKSSVESLMGMMDTFFALMIVMSAALALAVIFNISSINIFERRRDIATLKVLGYHRKEINSLVHAENFIITAFGSVFGLIFGAVIYKYLLLIVVSQDMFFPYKITFSMAALSVALAFAFTWFTNWLLRGKTRRIDMVESLKGVE